MKNQKRDCPDCKTRLQPFWVPARRLGDEVELDRCNDCGGVWFDAGELSDASGKSVKSRNVSTDRRCPACGASLLQAQLADGPEVETCPSCRGTFLEARDLDALAKKAPSSRRPPNGTGFICDGCGARKPFSEGQATLMGLECGDCMKGRQAPPQSEEKEASRSAFGKFLGWLRGE
jgi:Zn-finger nucleic acid-binding protein